ncbi:MAG: hypothetical protein AB1696_17515 [Planctomycetota bacterium]
MIAKWHTYLALWIPLVAGCDFGITPRAGSLAPSAKHVSEDECNSLGLCIELAAGTFRKGAQCTFKISIRNTTADKDVVLPDFFLMPDFLDANSVRTSLLAKRGEEDIKRDLAPSWRNFFLLGPFDPRGDFGHTIPGLATSPGGFFLTFYEGTPSKELQRKELEKHCEEIQLHTSLLRTLLLPGGCTLVTQTTMRIPDQAEYVDLGMYFDAEKFGHKGKLTASVKGKTSFHKETELPIWQGFLYVFLKIPD